jgi:hypothetical protein
MSVKQGETLSRNLTEERENEVNGGPACGWVPEHAIEKRCSGLESSADFQSAVSQNSILLSPESLTVCEPKHQALSTTN